MFIDVSKQKYLSKFDENGKRISSIPMDITLTEERKNELLNDGYIIITQEEWEYYTDNRGMGENGTGYIRDPKTGKPVSAPPIVYTKSELANMAQGMYQSRVEDIDNQIIKATVKQDTELVQELTEEKQMWEQRYGEVLDAIENGTITKPDQFPTYEEE